MENRTSGNPDYLPPILILLLVRDLVTSEVIVLLLNGLGVIEFIGLGDGMRAALRWIRDFAFFTRDDEMTKILSFCTVEPVFQSLMKRQVSKGRTRKQASAP